MISPAKVKAREERAKAMYDLWAEEGKTFEHIGEIYQVSKQRVGQIIHGYVLVKKKRANL